MSKGNIVHIVGTGTIGEPLVGLFGEHRDAWNIEEVTFHKRTPKADDDHGYYGRILSQTVIPVPTLTVPNPRKLVGYCFTRQDGNSLLSSVAATLRYLDPAGFDEKMKVLRPYMFREI